jgi:hypothetical protein
VIVLGPAAPPVKLTVQVLGPLPLPTSTQDALVGETLAPLAVTLNVPVGALLGPLLVSATVTVQLLATPTATGLVQLTVVEVVRVPAAERYGPTNGPPSPTGAAPAGCTGSVDVSASARGILIRPLPVASCVPAGSALRAMRPTITPLLSVGSTAFMRAARPATCAAAVDVPLITM